MRVHLAPALPGLGLANYTLACIQSWPMVQDACEEVRECLELQRGLYELPYYVAEILLMDYIARNKCISIRGVLKEARVGRKALGVITSMLHDLEGVGLVVKRGEDMWCLPDEPTP